MGSGPHQLAHAPVDQLRRALGKQGETIWHFANGRNADPVRQDPTENKGYGNSVTLPRDVTDLRTAHQVLLSLCETVGMRMRRDRKSGSCITVSLRTPEFQDITHQRQMAGTTDITQELYEAACQVFDEVWDRKTPLRQIGVQVTKLSGERYCQFDLFSPVDPVQYERKAKLDAAVDALRAQFGEDVIRRARFLGAELDHMAGGLSRERRTGVTKEV